VRVVHPSNPTVAVVLITIGAAHLLSPLVEQLRILTEDSLGNSGIKISHALPRYEQAATVINK
jgi:hypothetical protein